MKKHDLRESKSSVVITQPDLSLVGWMKIWIKCCNVAYCYLNREDFTGLFNPSRVGHTSVESLRQYIWTVWRVLGFQLKKRGHTSDRLWSHCMMLFIFLVLLGVGSFWKYFPCGRRKKSYILAALQDKLGLLLYSYKWELNSLLVTTSDVENCSSMLLMHIIFVWKWLSGILNPNNLVYFTSPLSSYFTSVYADYFFEYWMFLYLISDLSTSGFFFNLIIQ